MKNLIIILIFLTSDLLIFVSQTNAQVDVTKGMDSMIQHQFMLNFMVPDIPAFLALEDNPSEMLKPSAPKDLAVMFSTFRSGNEFIIPKSFAAEFAPALFVSTKMKLHDYQTMYWLRMFTKTRLSLATKYNDESGINHLSAGLKFTLIDEGDYRSDTAFLNEKIYRILGAYENMIAAKKLAYLTKNHITALELAENETLSQQIEDTLILSMMKYDFQNSIDYYKRSHWNSKRLDFAYSIVSSSSDTLLQHAKIDKHLFWLVYAIKPGKRCDWAQIMFGLNEQLHQGIDNKLYSQTSVMSRAYFGTNKAKGFAEAQFKNALIPNAPKSINSLLFNFGLDLDIYSGVWIHLAGGVNNFLGSNARSELMGNMKIYLSLPENFKLF